MADTTANLLPFQGCSCSRRQTAIVPFRWTILVDSPRKPFSRRQTSLSEIFASHSYLFPISASTEEPSTNRQILHCGSLRLLLEEIQTLLVLPASKNHH